MRAWGHVVEEIVKEEDAASPGANEPSSSVIRMRDHRGVAGRHGA